jgi:hypothetical protein
MDMFVGISWGEIGYSTVLRVGPNLEMPTRVLYSASDGISEEKTNEPENCGFLINDCTAPLTVIVVVTVMVRVLGWH